MTVVLNLTPPEEANLRQTATLMGLAPEELVRDIVIKHLPTIDQTTLSPTEELFRQWAIEDAEMTDEQRSDNERIYAEIERNGIPRTQI